MIKRFVIALLLVVVICGGLVGFNLFRAKMISDFFANQQMPAVAVSAAKIEPITWKSEIDAIGTLRAAQGVDIATQAAGVVKSIDFQANDDVVVGQLLVQIDDAVERADLISAQASVERDQAQLERVEALRKTGVNSAATLEDAQTALATSEFALARIRAVLDQKAIEAPFAGTIGIPQIDVGQYLQPSDVIATLQQLDTMKVDFTVPEQRLGDMKMGQPAAFGLREGEFPYAGRITGIDPKIDPQTRMVAVRAEVENSDGELRPGQFARVRVELPSTDDVIALPQTAVVTSLYGDYVYLVDEAKPADAKPGEAAPAATDGAQAQEANGSDAGAQPAQAEQLKARQVFVTIGRRQGNLIEIVKGLEAGQTVITSGQNKLANNMPVTINNQIDPAAIALEGGGGASVNFSETFIRRPVLTIVTSILILLLGLQGFVSMTVREYPEVDESVVTVTTVYPGAGADLMQGFITTPIAKAVLNADNVDYVTSTSALGTSTVSVNMLLGADPDQALVDVLAKVQQVRGELPTDAEDPVVQKGTGQEFALMYLAVRSSTMTPEQVTEYLSQVVQPRFATVEGVGEVQILGGRNFAMRVWLDPVRLAARAVTAADVLEAIRASNFLSAPGRTENEFVAYALQTRTTLQTPEAFGELAVRANGDEIVRLRDVADVAYGAENDDVRVSFNDREGTFLGVLAAPGANALDVSAAVERDLPSIQSELPPGMDLELVYDGTDNISASIEEVFKTIAEAVIIVVLVILLFLGSFRSVLVPIFTIPLSLIGVCFILYLMGFSINLLTLLAMVLAIGLVVDDAIVVVENIHRHLEKGEPPLNAAIAGMREIIGPVIAMTITLAAVYAPIGFAQGLTGSLFREFAVTLAGAVIISGFIALTLSPMLAARVLKPHSAGTSRFQAIVDRSFDRVSAWYGRRVSSTLAYRPVTLMIVAALSATMVFLFLNTSSELAPEEDIGFMFSIVNAPPYATSDYTETFVKAVRDSTKDVPEVNTRFSVVGFGGSNSAFAGFGLVPWSERTRSQADIQGEVQNHINGVAGVQAFVFAPPTLPGSGGGLPVQYIVRSTGAADTVFEVAEGIKNRAQASGRFIMVQNSLAFSQPQALVTIDRDRAAALGVSVSDIGTTLTALVGGGSISKFDRESRSYDVITQVRRKDRFNPESLGDYYVRSASGGMVPLSAVITTETRAAPVAIEQFNQLNSATISGVPLPGVTTGDALATIRGIAREVMPAGFFEDFSGQSRLEIKEGNTTLIAFGLAVIIIYLVLAAQFESFRDPLVIMLTVPLSIFGALVPLNLGLASLNIYTQVGLITLVGLITKHGILMVEFANQQREHGLSRHDAIVEAARVRLRPILMTTAAMVLGVAPLIIASGAGAKARFSIGLVIAAGMAIGTLFTLFVLPMFYTFIAHRDKQDALARRAVPRVPAPAE